MLAEDFFWVKTETDVENVVQQLVLPELKKDKTKLLFYVELLIEIEKNKKTAKKTKNIFQWIGDILAQYDPQETLNHKANYFYNISHAISK